MNSILYEQIYDVVRTIPKGKVATYGQVAAKVGNRNLARVIGNALHANPYPGVVPCHRVVNSRGELSNAFAFGGLDGQKQRLTEEGIALLGNRVDLKQYQVTWN